MSIDKIQPLQSQPPFPTGPTPSRSRRSRRGLLWLMGTGIPVLCGVGTLLFVPGVEHGSDLQTDLTAQVGAPVTCPDDLTARAGASMVCSAVDTDGSTHHLLITVTAAHGFYPINRTVEWQATVQD